MPLSRTVDTFDRTRSLAGIPTPHILETSEKSQVRELTPHEQQVLGDMYAKNEKALIGLVKYVGRLTVEEAEDCVSEAAVSISANIASNPDNLPKTDNSAKALFTTAALNKKNDLLRKKMAELKSFGRRITPHVSDTTAEEREIDPPDPSTPIFGLTDPRLEYLEDALNKLTSEEVMLLRLLHVEGLSYQEIATLLQPEFPNAIKTKASRARRDARQTITLLREKDKTQ